MFFFDHVSNPFADHDARSARMGCNGFWNDTSVGHPQIFDAVNLEFRRDDCSRIVFRSHFRRSYLMMKRNGERPQTAFPVLIRIENVRLATRNRRFGELRVVRLESWRLDELLDVPGDLDDDGRLGVTCCTCTYLMLAIKVLRSTCSSSEK